jgi:hypothetical protein
MTNDGIASLGSIYPDENYFLSVRRTVRRTSCGLSYLSES